MNGYSRSEAWIFDPSGTPRHGWLEITRENDELRPADRSWQRVVGFPADDASGTARLAMWADQRDKYVLRLDLGNIQRWVVCERLPALLYATASLNALIQLGRR